MRIYLRSMDINDKDSQGSGGSRLPANPFPPHVRRVGIPAPASMPDSDALSKTLELMRQWGVEAAVGENVFTGAKEAYLSAVAGARLKDFNSMLTDPSIDMILCARGGYGSAQLLPEIDWDAMRRRRMIVAGYSDISALHLGMLAKNAGVPVVTQMATTLNKSLRNKFTAASMSSALKAAIALVPLNSTLNQAYLPNSCQLESLKDGSASGFIIAANLTILVSLLGTPFMPSLAGAILVIEDVGERVRVLDRHLTQLRLSGVLSRCAGIVFGGFKSCGDRVRIRTLMEEFSRHAGGPVLCGLPFGHSIPSMSFVQGEPASISPSGLFLSRPSG